MKYINLINEFWRLNAIEPFCTTDISVYFYLLNQCNLRYWENPFSVTTHQIEVALNVSRKTIMASRNRLRKRGLLTVKNRGKKPAILSLAGCDSTSEGYKGPHSRKHMEEQDSDKPETKSTHIKREKNKEERNIKKHSFECQKSERNPTKSDSPRYVAFNDWINENAPYVASHLKPLSELEFDKLIEKFGPQSLARNIDNLENRSDLRRRYTSLYRTMLNWCAKDPLV